jgi:hypothetical protein
LIVRLVKTGDDREEPCIDVMRINGPDDLGDIANLGLTLAEGKRLLSDLQQEIVAVTARSDAVQRPDRPSCGSGCRAKDDRGRTVAGQVTVRLARFRSGDCGGNEADYGWTPHCRSTPESDRPRRVSPP